MSPNDEPILRVLFVEDSPDDVELVLRELGRGGWTIRHQRVETAEAMREAIEEREWDLVLSDYGMPRFSGPAALALLQETGVDLPFIMVSGTIDEQQAVESLRAGAEDFLVKDTLHRLVPAVQRELRDAADRRSRRRAERELHEQERMLLQAQKMEALGRLAGGVAHDFNNLLTIIGGSVQMLREHVDEERAEEVEEILRATERGADLTRQLLSFGRGSFDEVRVVDLHDLVEGIEGLVRRLLPDTIRLEMQLAASDRLIRVDPGRIEQALLNLTINAQDAMPEGGQLGIATRDAGASVELVVRDTGTGMEPGIVDRVFDPFFTTKEPGKGTGLGLAIVYGAVEKAGGAIDLDTKPGEGTTFTIRLPVVAEPAPAAAVEVPDMERRAVPPDATVMVVEDDESVRTLVQRILERRGYRVLSAENGDMALEMLESAEEPVDLVLSDLMMPVLDGADLARRLEARENGPKHLLMSGQVDPERMAADILEGAPMLWKPFGPEELLAFVRRGLDDSSDEQQPEARPMECGNGPDGTGPPA